MAVMAHGVIKHLNVVKDISARQLTRFVDAFLDPLFLQAAEERLSNGIVPAVAATTHAGFKPMRVTEAQPVIATVL